MANLVKIPELLAKKGYSVIPVNGDKTPLGAWKVRQSEPYSISEISEFIKNGQENFALVAGVNDIVCIDIDTKNVLDMPGQRFYDQLVSQIPPEIWYKLVVQYTPSGGYHIIYCTNKVDSSQHLAVNANGKPIIETRGKGGYFLIEPSKGYTIVEGELENIQYLSEEEQNELFQICRSFTKPKPKSILEPNFSASKEIEKMVEICLDQIDEQKIDLTGDYNTWIRIGFAFVNQFGELGREKFHRVSQYYKGYDFDDCDQKYSDLLNSSAGGRRITIATFFGKVKAAGIKCSDDNDNKLNYKLRITLVYLDSWKLRYNEFNRRTEIYGGQDLEDRHLNSMYADLQEMGISASRDYIGSLIHSNRTLTYHPIKDFLDRAKEEPFTDEFDRFIGSLKLVESEPDNIELLKLLIEKWLLQIPGVIYDELPPRLVLVLIGSSHIGKTHLFRNLLPKELSPYYAESALNNGKDSFILMGEKLLINNDEFGGIMRMNEMEQFKRMASAEQFDERRSYGRFNEKFKRRAILAGTSNRSEVIMDHTAGNTRIIPIEITEIDHALFNSIDKTKLLANVLDIYQKRGKGCSNLSFSDSDALQEYSKGFQTVNFEQEAILTLYEPGTQFYTSAQLAENIKREYSGSLINPRKLAQELRTLNFPQSRRRINGRHVRGWLVSPVPNHNKLI